MNAAANLPVHDVLHELLGKLQQSGAAILRAPPGAGKTTLVPLAMLHNPAFAGRILMTQPRRLAARTAAARLSQLNQTPLGREIGYQVRMERNWGADTRVVVMTGGIVLRRLLIDPYLEGVSVVVLDEFHERSLEMDLILGFLIQLRRTVRPDLKVLVMSATIDCGPIAEFLGSAPVIESEGRMFDVRLVYARQISRDPVESQIAEVLPKILAATAGHILVFLPGVAEIVKTQRAVQSIAAKSSAHVWQLFGDMAAADQDQVLQPSPDRKIILATNVAETSLTIDGVSGVIDSGLVRIMRFDASVGLSRLVLEPNSVASADQRAGRAGRQSPGICYRLWPESMNRGRAAFDTPEVLRGDLSAALLQLSGMGESDFAGFPWLTTPPPSAVQGATFMLQAIDALEQHRITESGRQLLRLPVAPRLARLLVSCCEAGIGERGALAAALMSERDPFRVSRHARRSSGAAPVDRRHVRGTSDLVDKVSRVEKVLAGGDDPDVHRGAVAQVVRSAQYLMQCLSSRSEDGDRDDRQSNDPADRARTDDPDRALRQAIWRACPDRLARRRHAGSDRGLMVGGIGVRLSAATSVLDAELFACVEVEQRDRDAEVRMASAVEREWLDARHVRVADEYFFHPTQKIVQARRREYWYDLVISESSISATDRDSIAEILYEQALQNWSSVFPASDVEVGGFLQRIACLRKWLPEAGWPQVTDDSLHEIARQLCQGRRSLEELRSAPWADFLLTLLPFPLQQQLDLLAPRSWTAPGGNRLPIQYDVARSPKISIRLQELFGLAETPRIAGGKVSLLLELLGPNYRAQQVTEDLASFWRNTYPLVRKELKRRYPKHHWPEDPLAAVATRSGLKRDAE
jgi:ATP-dependent helicase HrpB